MSFLKPKMPPPVAPPELPPPPPMVQSPQGIKPRKKPAQRSFLGPEMLPDSSGSLSSDTNKTGKTLLGA